MKTGSFAFLGFFWFASIALPGLAFAKGEPELPPVQTMDYVDLTRYAGIWHQVGFIPTRFQGRCLYDTTAEYTIRPNGAVHVRNQCSTLEGKVRSIEGNARIRDRESNAKLKVKFFWFLPAGDYWILFVDPEYQNAVVGSPDRKYLWILSRSETIPESLYQDLLKKASDQGYDPARVMHTGPRPRK